MAEQRRQGRDVDAGCGKTVLERRIGDDSRRARHGLDALECHQRELRIRTRQPLVSQQCICDAPTIIELTDQIFSWHHDIIEEHLAELVIARMVLIGLILMPGPRRSSSRKLMPACRGCACGSVRTSANIQSEWWAQVVQIFCPRTTK